MNKTKMDSKVLDSILMKMLKTVDGSKDEVFQIGSSHASSMNSWLKN